MPQMDVEKGKIARGAVDQTQQFGDAAYGSDDPAADVANDVFDLLRQQELIFGDEHH